MSKWTTAGGGAVLAALLGAAGIIAYAHDRSADPAAADYIFGTTVGSPLRTAVTGECVRTGYAGAGAPSPDCGTVQSAAKTPPAPAPAAEKAPPAPVQEPPAPPPVAVAAPAEEPLPEFVPEPEPADMVPVPPITAAEADDGIDSHTVYYEEDAPPTRAEDTLSHWENPDYAQELAAAEAQMARANLPPPAPPLPAPEPPAPEPPVVAAQPAPPPRILQLTLEGETHFGFSKYDLSPRGREQVDRLAGELKSAQYDAILVTGHTDRIGSKAYNQQLSQRRALSVKQYLMQHGIDASRIQAKWVGAAEPITAPGTCDGLDRPRTIQCLAPDRRVEVRVINARPR